MLVSNAHGQCSVAMLPGNGTYVRTNVLTKSVVTLARYQDFRNAHARIRIAEVVR